MIYKSYLVEDNLEILKNNITLFYGDNLGLIDDFKKKISTKSKSKILNYTQTDIINNEDIILNEIRNVSLFEEKKIFFIQDVNDKILELIKKILNEIKNDKLFLFANLLEKRSKLRTFFEKERKTDVVPCYPDNEITLKKLISNNLKNFSGITPVIINTIINNCGKERSRIKNEIGKIKSYYENQSVSYDSLIKILNLKEDNDFNLIKDIALSGNNSETNKVFNSAIIEPNSVAYYISVINNRLFKLKEIKKLNSANIDKTINDIKPPIFWKDKPIFINQLKIWNLKKITSALEKTYEAEMVVKTSPFIDKKIIIKKLLIDICNLANAA